MSENKTPEIEKIEETKEIKKNKYHTFLMAIAGLLLTVAVCVSAAILGIRLGQMADNDDDAISLIPTGVAGEEQTPEGQAGDEETTGGQNGESQGEGQDGENSETSTDAEEATEPTFVARPGFQASDDMYVWTTDTQVEIFRLTYFNKEGQINVRTENGDKLIAPGTSNTYTFKFKNTGNVAMDYTMYVEAIVQPGDITLPVQVRMNRYDTTYLVGDSENWAPVAQLDGLTDSATLGVSRYAYYTLEWQWPFDGVNDSYDTDLGNMVARGEDITLTIRIRTVATTSANPNAVGGIINTGDETQPVLWIVLMAAGGILILLLILRRKKDEEDADEQPEERKA